MNKFLLSIPMVLIATFPLFTHATNVQEIADQLIYEVGKYNVVLPFDNAIEYATKILQSSGEVQYAFGTLDNPIVIKSDFKGENISVNGRIVRGSLGSKTTYGDNSPIIENNTGNINAGGLHITLTKTILVTFIMIVVGVGIKYQKLLVMFFKKYITG